MSKKRTNTTKSTELSINGQFSANDVVQVLRDELKSLKEITECAYKTGSGANVAGINIKDETNIQKLLKAGALATSQQAAYNEYCAAMGITEFPQFTIDNHTIESVNHDIKLKMDVIRYADRKAELEGLLKEAETFMTVDDKKLLFLAKLKSSLGK